MSPRGQSSPRRSEVQQRLARTAHVRVFRPGADADAGPDLGHLGETLTEMGAVFSAFGAYLSTRADLLTRAERDRLAHLGTAATPLPPDAIRRMIAQELGGERGRGEVDLESVEDLPFDARPTFQRHHGRLTDGAEVVVRITRRDGSEQEDLDLLPLLRGAIAPHLPDGDMFPDVVEDFRATFLAQTNAHALEEALEFLRRDASDLDELRIPTVHAGFTTPRLLVVSRLPGRRLSDLIRDEAESIGGNDRVRDRPERGAPNAELARLLCEVWLRQASDGGMVPVEFRPQNVVILSSRQVGLDEGTFAVLPRDTRLNLLKYLVAIAAEDPHKAIENLLKEFDGSRQRLSPDRLDRLFRQMVPEADGPGPTPLLADTVLEQWRLALENGYRPHRQAVSLLHGLMQLVETTRGLTPRRDPLLEGLKDLRVARLLGDIGAMLEPTYWLGRLDKIAALVLTAPRVVDAALSAAATAPDPPRPGRSSSLSGTQGFALTWLSPLLLIAIVLLYSGDGGRPARGPTTEFLKAGIVLLGGAWLLRNIVTSGS